MYFFTISKCSLIKDMPSTQYVECTCVIQSGIFFVENVPRFLKITYNTEKNYCQGDKILTDYDITSSPFASLRVDYLNYLKPYRREFQSTVTTPLLFTSKAEYKFKFSRLSHSSNFTRTKHL